MNNKNLRYVTFLFGFFLTIYFGAINGPISLFYFGGYDSYPFVFGIEKSVFQLLIIFTPYILCKIWQSYQSES